MAGKSCDPEMRAALVGKGISRSLTPAMHEAEGRVYRLNYKYDFIDTETNAYRKYSLFEIIENARTDGLLGLNITHPYKVDVTQYLDKLSENARKLRAVNTIVFQGKNAVGYNTDYTGFFTAFLKEFDAAPIENVLLLGAGGAGAAVGLALLGCGVHRLQIYDTEVPKAKALRQLLLNHYPLADVRCAEAMDRSVTRSLSGVVNATPMGMVEFPGSAFPLELLSPEMWVSDIVYFPLETRLLAYARALGCRVMTGSEMAIAQAVHSFELFTGFAGDSSRFYDTFTRLSTD